MQAGKRRPRPGMLHGGMILVCGAATLIYAAQEQYPKPLIHTPSDHPAARVILISIDGMHATDLAYWVTDHPRSALAELSARGVTYTNAHVPWVDPAAGLVALATGGTPLTTGILSSEGYDRALSPPGSRCQRMGASIVLDRSDDLNDANDMLDAAKMPLNPRHGCAPVFPHDLLRVNNIFKVIKDNGGRTAWAGEDSVLVDLFQGPSGDSLDEVCGFEREPVNSNGSATSSFATDDRRVAVILHWIDSQDCTGKKAVSVPELFGINFVSVSSAQMAKGMGYLDASGTPSPGLEKSLAFVDGAIGRIVSELKKRSLYDSTWIIVSSNYGQMPTDQQRRRFIRAMDLATIGNGVRKGIVAHVSVGRVGMVWLKDSSMTPAVVKAYSEKAAALGIQDIYSGPKLELTLNSPEQDTRMPDIILQPESDVYWVSTMVGQPSHAQTRDEDAHVALLVSGAQLTGRVDKTWVPTSQVAPLLLRALGIEKFDLEALHREHTPALPGIF
jgi:hypothetical protein